MRLPRPVRSLLCLVGVHEFVLQHETVPGHLGAPDRKVAFVACWHCGRRA